jgi:hypothetical protein
MSQPEIPESGIGIESVRDLGVTLASLGYEIATTTDGDLAYQMRSLRIRFNKILDDGAVRLPVIVCGEYRFDPTDGALWIVPQDANGNDRIDDARPPITIKGKSRSDAWPWARRLKSEEACLMACALMSHPDTAIPVHELAGMLFVICDAQNNGAREVTHAVAPLRNAVSALIADAIAAGCRPAVTNIAATVFEDSCGWRFTTPEIPMR